MSDEIINSRHGEINALIGLEDSMMFRTEQSVCKNHKVDSNKHDGYIFGFLLSKINVFCFIR